MVVLKEMSMNFECSIQKKSIKSDTWFKKLFFDIEAKSVRKRVEDKIK